MTKPLLPREILANRQLPAPSTSSVSGMPTSQPSSLFTISTPPPPPVFSIVCWNVQTFTAGKAEANPYVNLVIRGILEVLEADLCILLETRDHPSANLAAIEHRLANPSSYKPDESSEDQWELLQLEDESRQHLRELEELAAVPISYQTLASDLTGKLFKPPYRIYLHPYVQAKNSEYKDALKKHEKYHDYRDLAKRYECSAKNKQKKQDSVREQHGRGSQAYKKARETTKRNEKLAEKWRAKAWKYRRHKDKPKKPFIQANFDKKLSSGGWKQFYDEYETLQHYYVPYRISTGAEIADLSTVSEQDEDDIELRLRRCGSCNVHRGHSAECEDCVDFGPYSTGLSNLRDMLAEVSTLRRSKMQLETYAALIKPGNTESGRPDGLIMLQGKAAGVSRFGCRLLRFKPPPLLSSLDRLGLLQRKLGVAETKALDMATKMALDMRPETQSIPSGSEDAMLEEAMNRLAIPTHEAPSKELGFGTRGSSFFGRSPMLIPLLLRPYGASADLRVPLVAFHAPYGKDTTAGYEARMAALVEVREADVDDPARRPFCDVDAGILIGDLNLDLAAKSTVAAGRIARQAYESLNQLGYEQLIPAVKSSVVSNTNTKWKKLKLSSSHVGSPLTKKSGPTVNFTSSAYDNVLVKGTALRDVVRTAAVVDVIGWIEANLSCFDLGPARKEWDGFDNLSDDQKAAWIYRTFVSDHLPIVLDLLVEPLDHDFAANTEVLTRHRKVEFWRQTIRFFELRHSAVNHVQMCPPEGWLRLETQGAILDIGWLESIDTKTGALRVTLAHGSHTFARPSRSNYNTLGHELAPVNESYQVISGGTFGPGDPLAIITDKPCGFDPGGVQSATSLMPWSRAAQVIKGGFGEPKRMLVVGQVTRLSNDGKRFRLEAFNLRCTLPVPDGGIRAGDGVMAIVEEPQLDPITVER